MNIPFLDLKTQYLTVKEEIKSAIEDVLEAQQFILGPKVEEFEHNIATYSGTKYAVGVSSGTDALLISLMALDIKPSDGVITSAFTFFATAGSISRLQAIPVFVDIDPITYNIDPEKIENAITNKTKAIMPVHLFGQCADMEPILEIAEKYDLYVIEDAAQSIGAEYKGQKAGSMGNLGIFSFFPSKNLGGFGDGGMVITNDDDLYKKIKILRIHGSEPKYYHKMLGGNFRLDAIQAAILVVKLKHLDKWSQLRRNNAEFYDRKFSEAGLLERNNVILPQSDDKGKGDFNYHVYNQYTIRANKRDELREYLTKCNIGTAIYYPCSLHLQPCFSRLGYKKGDLPISEELSKRVLSLPIYPELGKEHIEYIVAKVTEFYNSV